MKNVSNDPILLEMSILEMENVNGGIAPLLAIPIAKVFMWGVGTGIAIGLVVLDNILD